MPEFDAAVFAPTAKTGVLLKPVNTAQYGWFVIEPLAAIDAREGDARGEGRAGRSASSSCRRRTQQVATAWMTKIDEDLLLGREDRLPDAATRPRPIPARP